LFRTRIREGFFCRRAILFLKMLLVRLIGTITMLTDTIFERLDKIKERFQEIENLLVTPEVVVKFQEVAKLSRERAAIEDTVKLYDEYTGSVRNLEQTEQILVISEDQELLELAREEIAELKMMKDGCEERLRIAVLPKNPSDDKDVIVEIRAGAGGDEAALFVGDLYRMYGRYAQNKGWDVELINSNETGIGGYKEIIFGARGFGAFSKLKHERGTHRVQRVPTTEASGRIHTSTATVAVLPEADDVDIKIDSKDIRVDIFHSGGPGGQNVNKVASAVRVTHIPTGIVAVCQNERSQHKNRAQAMSVVRARLMDIELQKQEQEIAQARRSMVGGGDRSEKIRTYNFPQSRITDHRINLTSHALESFLEGEIDEMIEALTQHEQAQLLEVNSAS
jgi:peptide chain release factor 1